MNTISISIVGVTFSFLSICIACINYRSTKKRDRMNSLKLQRDILLERRNMLNNIRDEIVNNINEFNSQKDESPLYKPFLISNVSHLVKKAPVSYLSRIEVSRNINEISNNIVPSFTASVQYNEKLIEDLDKELLDSNYIREKNDIEKIMKQNLETLHKKVRQDPDFKVTTTEK